MRYFRGVSFSQFHHQPRSTAWAEVQSPQFTLHFCPVGRILCGFDGRSPLSLSAPVAWWSFPGQHLVYGSETGAVWEHFTVAFEGPRAEAIRESGFFAGASQVQRVENPEIFATRFCRFIGELESAGETSGRTVHEWERLLLDLREKSERARPVSGLEIEVQNWLQQVRSEPQQEWNLAEVARAMAVSPAQLGRVVKRQVGVAPYRFVIEQRLDLAATSLRSNRLPMKTIANASGFRDLSYFQQLFMARYGLPPAQYRQVTRLVERETSRLQQRRRLFQIAAQTLKTPKGKTSEEIAPFADLQFKAFGRGAFPSSLAMESADYVLLFHRGGAWCGELLDLPIFEASNDSLFVVFSGPRAEAMKRNGLFPTQNTFDPSDPVVFKATFAELLDSLKKDKNAPLSIWLLEELLLQLDEKTAPTDATPPLESENSFKNEVRLWLEAVRQEPCQAESMAAVVIRLGVTPTHFRRVVKEVVGLPPHRYILERRLEMAAARLRERSEPIKSLAASCGFSDVAYFTRIFTLLYGMPPAAYRRESQVFKLEETTKSSRS